MTFWCAAPTIARPLAIVDGARRLSYRQVNDWVNRTAHGLSALGYQRGNALGLMSTNNAEFLITYFACAKLGLICVPINLFWRHTELGYVLGHAAIKGMVVEAGLLEQLERALADCPDVGDIIVIDPATTQPVAGRAHWDSTSYRRPCRPGEPEAWSKTATHFPIFTLAARPRRQRASSAAIWPSISNSLGVALDTHMTGDDRVTVLMPLFHTAQLNVIATPAVAVGATMFIQRGFDAVRLADLIETERLTLSFALPMMYRALLEQLEQKTRDVSSLRLAIYAMAPMPTHELRKAIETLGCDFALMFGQTEMNPLAVYFRPEHQLSHPGAVGTPSVNVQVAIMDDAGAFLPEGEAGEIVYRSPQVLSGYLRDPEATDGAFANGWFHSGDCGHFDADGILWFKDRFKDVIKSGGENVASIEVEKALYAADPAVQEVAVIGLPHERWGEAVTAVVIVKAGQAIDEQTLMTKVRDHLSPFKCPKRIIFTDAMPKTATGKVQKAKLRNELAELYQGG